MKYAFFFSLFIIYATPLYTIQLSQQAQARKLRSTIKRLMQGNRFDEARKLLQDNPQLLGTTERAHLRATIESADIKHTKDAIQDISKPTTEDELALMYGRMGKRLLKSAKARGSIEQQGAELTQFFTDIYQADALSKNGSPPTNFTSLRIRLTQFEKQRSENPKTAMYDELSTEIVTLHTQYAKHLIGSIVWQLIIGGKNARDKLFDITKNILFEPGKEKVQSDEYRARLTKYIQNVSVEEQIKQLEFLQKELRGVAA